MATPLKNITIEQKVAIVKQAEQQGITETALEYGISTKSIYRWRDKLLSGGSSALRFASKVDPELKDLRIENDRLKKLIAKQALIIDIKEELLKKTLLRTSKNNKL